MQEKIHAEALPSPRLLIVIATLGKRNDLLKLTLDSIISQDIKADITLVYPLKNKETALLAKTYNAVSLADSGSMSSAVNLGISNGWDNHEYIGWIGDDDLYLPGSFKATVGALDRNKSAVAAFGYCKYIDQNGKQLFISRAGWLAPFIASWGPDLIPLPGTIFRSSALKKLDNLFDVNLKYAMDLDLFLRLKRIGKLISVARTVSAFRWHTSSATVSNREASLKETEEVRRRYTPKILKPFTPVWEIPVRIATRMAAKRVNRLGKP